MKITDEFYSNLNDGEVQDRIGRLGNNLQTNGLNAESIDSLIEIFQSLKTGVPKNHVNPQV